MSSAARVAAIQLIAQKSPMAIQADTANIPELFGVNVFGLEQIRERLPKAAYQTLQRCMERGEQLDAHLADLESVLQQTGPFAVGEVVATLDEGVTSNQLLVACSVQKH